MDAIDAALNAAVGDDLARRGTGLAIEMGLYDRGARVEPPFRATRLAVFVHGLGCTEHCWSFPDEPDVDYGRLLARDLGIAPLYVRYNTGLPIHENGGKLAELLADIVARAPDLEEMILIGHSLGGLVIRSACHHGGPWLERVRRAFYVGSPHLGSPVAKAGHVLAATLNAIDEPVVRAIAEVAELRSAAVRDLRLGDLVEGGGGVPLHPDVEHYVVGGSLANVAAVALGDGLVTTASATAAAVDPSSSEHVGLFTGLSHLTLAHHADVYAWIAARCGPPGDALAIESPTSTERRRAVGAYVALAADAVRAGASTVQAAHETIAARPYDVLEIVPAIAAPSRAVRAVHFGVLRGTYSALRSASAWLGDVARSRDGIPAPVPRGLPPGGPID